MKKDATLREMYDEINVLLSETEGKRKQFATAYNEITLDEICLDLTKKIFRELRHIKFSCDKIETEILIKISQNTSQEVLEKKVTERNKQKIQEYLDKYSEEKIKITEFSFHYCSYQNNEINIKVELL